LKVVGTKIQDQAGNPYQMKGISSYWLNWEGKQDAEGKAGMQSMRDTWKVQILRAAMGTDVSGGYIGNETAMQARIDTIMSNALSLGMYVIVDWHSGDAQNTQSQAVTFFTNLATKYGSCPNILYEDYNEPVNVTWAQIKPYHTAIVAAIRAKDPDKPALHPSLVFLFPHPVAANQGRHGHLEGSCPLRNRIRRHQRRWRS
jgi:endoglucanase